MKNDNHRAYYTLSNFPLQIASLDSIRAHMLDQIRVIAMMASEWPKIRGRDFTRKNYYVTSTTSFTTMDGVEHAVEIINFNNPEYPIDGFLVDGKYYFSGSLIGQCPSLQLLFEPFEQMGVVPMVRREWNSDYMVNNPEWVALVPKGTTSYSAGGEQYFPILGYKEIHVNTIADLMAYSYRFRFDPKACEYNVILDMLDVTKRIRKPWFEHLVQIHYGERDHVTADNSKLIAWLIDKCQDKMTDEERAVLAPFTETSIDMAGLERLANRRAVLNQLFAVYNHPTPMVYGEDPSTDPLFDTSYHTFKEQ